MPHNLEQACEHVVTWALGKLNAGDGLSCLLWASCDHGEEAAVYIQDSMEEALELLRHDLIHHYRGVRFYVIAFDGSWVQPSGVLRRAVFTDVEDRQTGLRRRRAYFIHPAENGELVPTGEFGDFTPESWSLFA